MTPALAMSNAFIHLSPGSLWASPLRAPAQACYKSHGLIGHAGEHLSFAVVTNDLKTKGWVQITTGNLEGGSDGGSGQLAGLQRMRAKRNARLKQVLIPVLAGACGPRGGGKLGLIGPGVRSRILPFCSACPPWAKSAQLPGTVDGMGVPCYAVHYRTTNGPVQPSQVTRAIANRHALVPVHSKAA